VTERPRRPGHLPPRHGDPATGYGEPVRGCCRRGGYRRQLEGERRAAARLRRDPDPTSHPPDELTADVEPETGSTHARRLVGIEPMELLEDPLLLRGRNAPTLVTDAEAHVPVRAVEPYLDQAAVG
jgi:hypothetical protein